MILQYSEFRSQSDMALFYVADNLIETLLKAKDSPCQQILVNVASSLMDTGVRYVKLIIYSIFNQSH